MLEPNVPTETEALPPHPSEMPRTVAWLLLAAIVLIGGYFRFVGLNWDDFTGLHPDERFLTMNLLPNVGGLLEFTPDENNFPSLVLLVAANETRFFNRVDVQADVSALIGVTQGSREAEYAAWWAGASRLRAYPSPTVAIARMIEGEVQAVVLRHADLNQANAALGASLKTLEIVKSEDVQRTRCLALYPDTAGVGGYFDARCSSLNPHNSGAGFYAYGTLPLFAAHFLAGFVRGQALAGSPLFQFEGYPLIWRFLSAFFDAGAIVLVYLIGARLYGRRVGLLAALLYACAPLAIQKAHYGTVNAMTAFFVTLALWAVVGVQERGRWFYYAVFGVALGCALAGRINVAPLAGIVVVAALVYVLPQLSTLTWQARQRLFAQQFAGLVLAGALTILVFRIANPYAFVGAGFFGVMPNDRFLADLASSRFGVSGEMDSPPNWQWVGRAAYLYPLKDMVLWGMGLVSGVLAWVGIGWASYQLVRGQPLALRHAPLLVWAVGYFGYMGNLWVMTMRYYLPLYSTFALFAAWAVITLWQHARQGASLALLRAVLGGFALVFGLIPVYYAVNGEPLTQTAWLGAFAAVWLGSSALLPRTHRLKSWSLVAVTVLFALLWAMMFTNIYRNQLTRVQASRWLWENISGDFSLRVEGAPEGTPLINIAIANFRPESSTSPEALATSPTRYVEGQPHVHEFTAPADGVIREIYAPHLGDPLDTPDEKTLYVSLGYRDEQGVTQLLAEQTLKGTFARDNHVLGDAYAITLDTPIAVERGKRYLFKVEVLEGTLIGGGSVVVTEGDWDDRLTTTMICTLPEGMTLKDRPPSGLVSFNDCKGTHSWYALIHSYDMAMSYPVDETLKLNSIRSALHVGDYVAISSNRFYDTLPRNRQRFPLSSAYYDMLFAEQLGYELVAVFDEHFAWGGFSVADQHLPVYRSPQWFNEFEADEAFHVYDHPAVFIFKKRADYSAERVDFALNSISLMRPEFMTNDGELGSQIANVVYWTSLQASAAPNGLMLAPDTYAINRDGGTWSERFASMSLLNTNEPIGVVVWWLALLVFGWLAFPLLYVLFPFLADRGYGFAKLIGLFLVSYLAWFFAGIKVPLWSQVGVLLCMIAVAAGSLLLVWRVRAEFLAHVRAHARQLLTWEAIALLLYVAFIGVRLTNPDLWHDFKGGEKPMDFAYFNAVLRTTAFPPPDPWYAGGYINYYYWGYVLFGAPVLLLQIVPAFAYNLLIPTVFAITGLGAYSAAYNIAHSLLYRARKSDENKPRRRGDAHVAGTFALLLCVVLGNLDTIRVFVNGVAVLGGYEQPQGIEIFLLAQYPQPASPEVTLEVAQRVQAGYLTDRLAYEWHNAMSLVGGFISGFGRMLQGVPLPIGTDRWYWAPSRVLAETPGVGGNAITEMPYFTFLYGDLHAHMLNLPVLLFAVAFVFHEVLAAARGDSRSHRVLALAIGLGAGAIGMIRAINTWDFPAFMLFGVIGLGYAWWLRYASFSLASLRFMLVSISGFVVAAFAWALPYTTWYAATYGSVQAWTGGKTPLWAYFDIHGLFLFLLVSLLVLDTVRALQQTTVGALRGRGYWVIAGALLTVAVLCFSLALAMVEYQVALIVPPLVLWIGFLFFRPHQTVEMQYVLVLMGFALAMTLGVEVIVIAGDIGRQNTVFKFYMQVWILFSVAAGVAAAWLLRTPALWRTRWGSVWLAVLALLVFLAALFPIMATRGRSFDRMSPNTPLTLNGLAYMRDARHALTYANPFTIVSLSDDYAIIRWMQENVQGMPTIIEGRNVASEYTWTARVAINTGLPSVLGWRFHQTQQRTFDYQTRLIDQRELNVKYFYNTADIGGAVRILRHYNVSYIVVSGLERTFGTPEGIAKFEAMERLGLITLVHQQGEGRVYQVNREAIDDYAFINQR